MVVIPLPMIIVTMMYTMITTLHVRIINKAKL